MSIVTIREPESPATTKQLFRLYELSGKDTRGWTITKQQASDMIEGLELKRIEDENSPLPIDDDQPFTEAHVTICSGDQRGGKTNFAVKTIFTAYYKDAVRIFCENILKIECEVLAYNKITRVAKIKYEGLTKYIHIPDDFKLESPMKIFSNVHLCGLKYLFIPSFRHMLYWLRIGFISNGWLLSDESHRGMSARATQTAMGREFVNEYYQFGKSKLDVIIITHHPRMIDYLARMIPTKTVTCEYDKKTHKVTYELREKGVEGTTKHSYDASVWFPNYFSNEKVNS